MTFQPCPGIAEITLNYLLDDTQAGVNVLHASNGTSDPWSHSDLAALATAVGSWWHVGDGTHALANGMIANTTLLQTVVARDLTVDGSTIATAVVGVNGSAGAVPYPNGVSFCWTLRSGLTGKSQRGRLYSAGIAEAVSGAFDHNLADPTVAAHTALGMNALMGAISGYGGTETATAVILSRRHNGGVRDHGIGTPITSIGFADLALDYQRRRAPNHNRGG